MALSAIERALTLNASCATAHYFAALVNAFAHRGGAAADHANLALRLSPFDPSAFEAHLALGMGAIGEANYDEAAARFAKASQINVRHSLFPFFHAIALALGGRLEETPNLIRRGLELEPGFRIQIYFFFRIRHGSPQSRTNSSKARGSVGLPE